MPNRPEIVYEAEHSSAPVEAQEDQRRIERDRDDRVGGHAVNACLSAGGDNRDAGRQMAKRAAKCQPVELVLSRQSLCCVDS